MKKLLIATTALVGTASVAAADITFSGYGRFGVLYEEDRTRSTTGADIEETRLESRYRLNIDSSTTTDGGIRFAARIRVEANDNDSGGANAGAFSGARFQANVGGLRVRVGNVSGVHDSAIVVDFFGYEPGLIGQVGHYSTFGGGPIDAFSSTGPGANGVNALYEMGDFAIMASWSENLSDNDGSLIFNDYEAFEIGASYTFSGWTFGVGYGKAEYGDTNVTNGRDDVDSDFWTITASGSVGIADLALFIGDSDDEVVQADRGIDDDLAYGISAAFPVGAATTIEASYAGGGADDLDDAYGIGFDHSLGGGVKLTGMIGRNTSENTVADLGVIFNF